LANPGPPGKWLLKWKVKWRGVVLLQLLTVTTPDRLSDHSESKKAGHYTLADNFAKMVIPFSKSFHQRIQQQICNNKLIKDPTTC